MSRSLSLRLETESNIEAVMLLGVAFWLVAPVELDPAELRHSLKNIWLSDRSLSPGYARLAEFYEIRIRLELSCMKLDYS